VAAWDSSRKRIAPVERAGEGAEARVEVADRFAKNKLSTIATTKASLKYSARSTDRARASGVPTAAMSRSLAT
jgi:hypothetical protein